MVSDDTLKIGRYLLLSLLVIPYRKVMGVLGRCMLLGATQLDVFLIDFGATESEFLVWANTRFPVQIGLFWHGLNESWGHSGD